MNLEDKIFAAHLFDFLMCCERIAASCAAQQEKLASKHSMHKFFATQAKQEKHHAFIFDSAVHWLKPKRFKRINYSGLNAFENKLSNALKSKRLTESIVAQQLLFEGLGEITLSKVSVAIERKGLGFERARKAILKQEHAHHKFGEKHIGAIINSPQFDTQDIGKQCQDYLDILQTVLHEMNPILEFYNQTPQAYFTQMLNGLPTQLRAEL